MDAWIGAQLQGYILAAERLDMAHSVEVRLPLLDHELFDYAASVAPASLMKRTKFPLREAAWPVLPPRIKSMKMKKPFQAPPSPLVKGSLARMIEEVLTDPSLSRIEWLNAGAVRDFALAAPDGTETTAAFHFDLVALGLVAVVSMHDAYRM